VTADLPLGSFRLAGSPLLPTAPTGKPTQATGSHFVHWHNGQPTEIWRNGDWLGWLQACGVVATFG